MTKTEFYNALCEYYNTDAEYAKTRIKYLDMAIVKKVEYSENVIKRIVNDCSYFPTVVDINRLFQDRPNILKQIGG